MKKIVFKVLCIFLILFQGCKAGKRGLLDGSGQLSDKTEQTVHEQKSESDEVIENEYIKVPIDTEGRLRTWDLSPFYRYPDYMDIEQKMEETPIRSIKEYLKLYTDEELEGVYELSIGDGDLTEIDGLERLPNLRILSITGNKITGIDTVQFPPSLTALLLNFNMFEGTFKATPALHSITWFTMIGNKINRLEGFENLSGEMSHISFKQNPIENPEELLKLKNVKDVIEWGYAENISKDEAEKIRSLIRERNPNLIYQGAYPYDENLTPFEVLDDGL